MKIHILLFLSLAVSFRALALNAVEAYQAACERAGLLTGLAVHVGAEDLVTARELRTAGAALVQVIVDDPKLGQRLRMEAAEAGELGPISILDRVDPSRIPIVDEAALVTLTDADSKTPQEEYRRALRPHGTLYRAGNVTEQPWPEGYDGWYAYYYDATGQEVSNDKSAGPLVGMQWAASNAASRGQLGFRLIDGILIGAEQALPVELNNRQNHFPIARDAFTGLTLWKRPDLPFVNTYAFQVVGDRVLLHPKDQDHQLALDLKTGKTLTTYDQGIVFKPEQLKKGSATAFWQSLVHQDTLIQVQHSEMVALDLKTGERRWAVDLEPEGLMPYLPIVVEDQVVVVAGKRIGPSFAYNFGWKSMQLEELRSYSVKNGTPGWSWKEESEWAVFVQTMSYRKGTIGLFVWAKPEGFKGRTIKKAGWRGMMWMEHSVGKNRSPPVRADTEPMTGD